MRNRINPTNRETTTRYLDIVRKLVSSECLTKYKIWFIHKIEHYCNYYRDSFKHNRFNMIINDSAFIEYIQSAMHYGNIK